MWTKNLEAAAAGLDPLEFRLASLGDERMRGVLRSAAQHFGWTPAKAPSGRGWGIALGIDAGTYVALMAEVEVSRASGAVQVKRVVCAQPACAEHQIERAAHTNRARQSLTAAPARYKTVLCVLIAQARRTRGKHNVCGEHQFKTTRQTQALHGSDHR